MRHVYACVRFEGVGGREGSEIEVVLPTVLKAGMAAECVAKLAGFPPGAGASLVANGKPLAADEKLDDAEDVFDGCTLVYQEARAEA